MTSILDRTQIGLLLAAVALGAGCGPTPTKSTKGGKTAGGVKQYAVADLSFKLDEYMPPLDAGKIELAGPQGFQWTRAGAEYLVGFYRKEYTMNDLPRILVTAEDSPFPIEQVTEANVVQFAKLVKDTLGEKHVAVAVQPMILGKNACAVYVEYAKRRNVVVAREVIKIVAAERLYTIVMEVYEKGFAKYRDAGYAVAASLRVAGGTKPPAAEPGTETTPPAAETKPAAEEKPAAEAAEPEATPPKKAEPEEAKPEAAKAEAGKPEATPETDPEGAKKTE